MGQRLVLGLVAMVAIVAAGGMGFAAWTSVIVVTGSGNAGTLGAVEWGASPSSTPGNINGYSDSLVCNPGTVTGPTNGYWDSGFIGQYFAPGDYCYFANTISLVGGNVNVLLSETITISDTLGCLAYWTYADSIIGTLSPVGSGTGPVTVGPITDSTLSPGGPSAPFDGYLLLDNNAPTGCWGDTISWSATVTGTAI